jgi:hypothetical protein
LVYLFFKSPTKLKLYKPTRQRHTETTTLQEGLIEVGKGGIAPSIAAPQPPPPRAKPLKEPTRSQELWHPTSLLCRRFGVPVPQHAKLTPAVAGGGGGGAGQQRLGGAGGSGRELV